MKRAILILLSGVTIFFLPCRSGAQTTSKGEMPQYLFPSFVKCDVLMKSGQVNTPVMNFNLVSGKMVFLSNNNYYDMTNPEAVDTVYLNGSKFIPSGKSFYEVLISGPVSLFVHHKGMLSPPGKPVGYGGTSQVASVTYISSIELSGMQVNLTLPADYTVTTDNIYWIREGEKWSDFSNEKQFLAIFPDKAAQLKAFIKKNKLKFDKYPDLIDLMKYMGTL